MESSHYKWGTVVIACISIFIIVLDSSAMNVAITDLVGELNTSLSVIQAIMTLCALIVTSFMLLGSKIQNIMGRKRIFLLGLIIYGLGNIIAALSINAGILLVGWAIFEGIGAALIIPATVTLLGASYEGKDKITAYGIWGGSAAVAAAIAPIVGGIFTTFLTWRLIFALELFFVILILLFRNYLNESKPYLRWKDLDVGGAVLSIVSLILIVLGILLFANPDSWIYVAVLISSGSILFIIFLLWQGRRINKGLEPLTDISLLKNRIFVLATVNDILQQIALAGFLFIMPVFLLQVMKLNAFDTGLTLLPTSIVILIVSYLGTRLTSIMGPKYILMIGFLISAVGTYLIGDVSNLNTQMVDIMPSIIVFGVGLGLLLSQLTNITMSAAREDQETDASGLFNTFDNLGYSVGMALMGVLLLLGTYGGLMAVIEESDLASNMTNEELQNALFEYVEKMQTGDPGVPMELVPQYSQIIDKAIKSSIRQVFNVLSLILILGFIISIFIPKRIIKAKNQ
ncbi:MAG: MFS transporter [Methanobacterium sp.]|nr:MFS transporter [Methanobacterium sp.]